MDRSEVHGSSGMLALLSCSAHPACGRRAGAAKSLLHLYLK